MSGASDAKKSSLWREGLNSFKRNRESWLKMAVIFFFVYALFSLSLTYYMIPYQAQFIALKGQKDPHAFFAVWRDASPTLVALGIAFFIILSAQKYMFMSYFMQREIPAQAVHPSVGNYFYFLGKIIQMMLVFAAPGVVIGLVVGIVAGILGEAKILPSSAVTTIFFLPLFVVLFYVLIRLSLMLPLAAAGIRAPMGSSWALTQNQCWGLIGNGLVLALLYIGLALLVIIASLVVGGIIGLILVLAGKKELIHGVILYVFKPILNGGLEVFVSGVACAYISTVTRVLYEEKQAAESGFKLVSSV
jgi:hypothetical protein